MKQRKIKLNIISWIALLLCVFFCLYVLIQAVFYFEREKIELTEDKKDFLSTIVLSYKSLNNEAIIEDYTNDEAIIKITDKSGNVRRHLFDLNKKMVTSSNYTGSLRKSRSIIAYADTSDNENTNSYTFNDDMQLEQIARKTMSYNFIYDEKGNVIQNEINDRTIIENKYDSLGNLKEVKYANGTTINYIYNEFSLLIEQYINGRCVSIYTYENGKVKTYRDLINDVTYSYNYKGDLISSINCSNGFKIEYFYNSNNQVIGKSYNYQGYFINYNIYENEFVTDNFSKYNNYDNKDRLTNSSIYLNDSNFEILNTSYIYDSSFKISEQDVIAFEDEAIEDNIYSTIVKQISNQYLKVNYVADELGNVKTYSANNNTIEMSYDDKNQLINYNINGKIDEVKYDSHGNILQKGKNIYNYENKNWQDQLTQINDSKISYDANGNPIKYLDNELSWEGRLLISYNNIHYTYNNSGIRTSKVNSTGKTEYLLDGKKVIFEQNSFGLIKYYYEAENIIGFNFKDKDYFYIKNAQDDIIEIVDECGQIVVEYLYSPWGEIVNISGELSDSIGVINPYRYHSYRYDEDTKLYYLNTRYYDPYIGRFINEDDMDYLANTILGDDLTKNLYTYCRNNPFNLEDINGTMSRAFLNMTKTLYADWGIISDGSIGAITTVLNGYGFYTGFHETAQLVAAKALRKNGAMNIELEKQCNTGEIDIYAEFGNSKEIWEVKPHNQQSSARNQLSKYVNTTGYSYGRRVGGPADVFEIHYMHKIYMQVSFHSGTNQGAITYKFIKRYSSWGKTREEEKSNAEIKKGLEISFWVGLAVAGTIIVATIAEDVLTAGVGICDDGPSLLAAANSFIGSMKFGFWILGMA